MKEQLKSFALDYSLAFSDMIATTITEGQSLAENFKNFVVDMVKQLAQLIIKMIVFKALMTALGMDMPSGGGGGGGIFGTLFGMQEGGLAYGPTPILVGEGRCTSISNPEVIAPLDKLKSMISGGMGGGRLHGSISGSNILLSNQRGLTSQDRVRGSVTDF